MKKLVILTMTVALMLSTLSCGLMPTPLTEGVELPSEEQPVDDLSAQPLTAAGEAPEILRPTPTPSPRPSATPSPRPSATPAPAQQRSTSGTSTVTRTQTYQNTQTYVPVQKPQPAAPTGDAQKPAAVVPAAQETSAPLPDLLTEKNFPDYGLRTALREQFPDGLTAKTIGAVTTFQTT